MVYQNADLHPSFPFVRLITMQHLGTGHGTIVTFYEQPMSKTIQVTTLANILVTTVVNTISITLVITPIIMLVVTLLTSGY